MAVGKEVFLSVKTKKNPVSARHTVTVRLTTDAVLVAVYVVLSSFVSINLPIAQFSLSSLPILLGAVVFGIPDAAAVALCGSFLEQVLYGLSPTAPLWMAAPLAAALTAGALTGLFRCLSGGEPRIWQTIVTVVTAELIMTLVNTGMLYLDAYIMQYTVKSFWVLLPLRLGSGALRTVCTTLLTLGILPPVRLIAARDRTDGQKGNRGE